MNPWVRLLAAVAAVVAAALLLKLLPPLVVLALFVGGTALAARTLKQRSKLDADVARTSVLGLRRDTEDPFSLRALPLSLFVRAPEGSIDEPMSGTWRGVEVRSFEYAFTSTLEGGGQLRRVFSCAMGPVAAPVPAVVVEPRAFVTMFPEPPGLDPVDVAEGRFANLFDVRSTDAELARSIVGDAMREFLLEIDEAWGFEVRERSAVVYGPRSERADPALALDALVGILDRLPRSVRTDRGPGVPTGQLPPDPDGDGLDAV